MKWSSHKILTGSIIYAVTSNPIAALIVTAGSILPDAIEGFPNESNYTAWRNRHRRHSHWFLPYLLISFLLYSYAYFKGIKTMNLTPSSLYTLLHLTNGMEYAFFAYVFSLILLGGVFHIVQDAFCGKVPLFNPRRLEIGITLFKVGSAKEYVYVITLSMMLLLIHHILSLYL